MAISNDVKVIREQRKMAVQLANRQLAAEIMRNPFVEVIAGFTAVELIQKYMEVGELAGTAVQLGLLGIVAAQQMSPVMPDLLAAGTEGIKVIGDVTAGLLPIATAL